MTDARNKGTACTRQVRRRAGRRRMDEAFTCDPREIPYITIALRRSEPCIFMESPRSLDRPAEQDGPLAPVTGNKAQRLAQHTHHLVEDLKRWVDLRIELAQMELEERVEAKANEIALGVVVAGVALLAVVFGLVTAALALGALLGHPAWGFLIVTALLALLAAVLRAARPELVQIGRGPAAPDVDAPDAPSSAA